MRLTGNPGGPGHHWVKARYIDNGPFKVITETEMVDLGGGEVVEAKIERVFIPAKLKDNQILLRNDPAYVMRLRQSGSAQLVKAWLEGNWDEIEGAFFSEFDEERHVLRGRLILPAHWTRFRAMDWGSAKPFSIGWYAVSDGGWLPRGALVKYREWYGIQESMENSKPVIKPNTGIKWTANMVAASILRREASDPRIAYGVADPSIFANNGGPSIAEMMMIEGCTWMRGDNARQPGWEQLHKRLACVDPDTNQPRDPYLYFHESCVHTIRTLPYLQHDEKDPEDLDTDGEDHAADETRYACMSRMWVGDAPPEEDEMHYRKPVAQMTIDELIARQSKLNRSREQRY
jgi:hypothetical protein